MTVHFISGLPRSGSTLLSGILNQNPNFAANIISPVSPLVTAMLHQMSMVNETSLFVTDEHRARMIHAAFEVFHSSKINGFVKFDTNRAWCSRLPLLTNTFINPRVICCVRNVADIMDSIERLIRRNAFQPSTLFNFRMDGTVYSRTEKLAGGDGLVGYALSALREACYGEHSKHIMLLRYETLVKDPAFAMGAVYDFIKEPMYEEHDFDNVELDATQFDLIAGTPGLHALKRKVEPPVRHAVLPPDLYERFQALSFWEKDQRLPPAMLI